VSFSEARLKGWALAMQPFVADVAAQVPALPSLLIRLPVPTTVASGAEHKNHLPLFAEMASRVLGSGDDSPAVVTEERELADSSGDDDIRLDRSVRMTATRVLDSTGAPLAAVVVAVDVTAQRRLEAERAQLKAARQASAAVRSAFANMSHELRTPLNAVLGFAELLLMSSADAVSDEIGSGDGAFVADASFAAAIALAGPSRGQLTSEQRESVHGILDSGKLLLRIISEWRLTLQH